ncbi:MAG TPA: ATP phosphoribosyltransferase regulatory subunit, partial [Phenylobacterium sp.]|nr:ATP phosphoribosyltransferase regulatory subunit [Phenylobacterium sp.]
MRAEAPVPPDRLAAIRAPFLAAGATSVDTPILQPLGLLLDLAGEAMRARLFVVQAEGGQEACLRPDFTVPVARLHLERGDPAGRYFYEGKVFRAAPEGSERAEEFLQIGIERFDTGAVTTEADAEIVALAWRAAVAGGRGDLSLWLGDIALFAAFIEGLDLTPSLAARLKRAASRPRLLQAELARAGQTPVTASEPGGLAGLLASLSPKDAGRMLQEVWALAGIEPVGGRGPRRSHAGRARLGDGARERRVGDGRV